MTFTSFVSSYFNSFLYVWARAVMFIIWILTVPFSLAYSSVIYTVTHGWAMAIAVAAVSCIFLCLRYKRTSTKTSTQSQIQPTIIINEIFKVMPLHPKNGWTLEGVSHGLRIFERFFTSLSLTAPGVSVLAGATLLDATPKHALKIILDTNELQNWFGKIIGPVQQITKPLYPLNKITKSTDTDTISITCTNNATNNAHYIVIKLHTLKAALSRLLARWLPFDIFDDAPSQKYITQNIERIWLCGDNSYVFSHPLDPVASSFPYQWSLFVLSPIPNQKDISVLTIITLPTTALNTSIEYLGFQLCSLRDHVLFKEFKVYDIALSVPADDNTSEDKKASSASVSKAQTALEPPSTSDQQSSPASPPQITFTGPYAEINQRYLQIGKECAEKLLAAANATVDDGWTLVGINKNVHIMKKLPQKDEPPVNCVKGSCKINLSPDFLLRVLMDSSHIYDIDDMLSKVDLVDKPADHFQLLHSKYKAMWPVAARDFCILNVFGRLDKQTRVHAAMSVDDPRVPEVKNFVRGNLLSGGYVIKDCPGQPGISQVIYITQVDLKGSVPAFIINKVLESQPQCVNRFRKLVEAEHSRLSRNPVKMKQFEDEWPIPNIVPASPPPPPPSVPSDNHNEDTIPGDRDDTLNNHDNDDDKATPPDSPTDDRKDEENQSEGDEEKAESTPPNGSPNGLNSISTPEIIVMNINNEEEESELEKTVEFFNDNQAPPTSLLLDKIPLYRTGSEHSDDSMEASVTSTTVTNTLIEYPRTESGIDFKTMGNQNAARLLEEMFHISELDLKDPSTYRDQGNGWKYHGIEKDVIILQKKSNDSPYNSFIGKGLIELLPQEVFNCVRNPNQRFTFDSMLKELHVVKQIEEGLYILHMHHETTQCFLKQARDFCLLVCERSEPNKKLIVGSSVEVPECLPQPNCTRGKILNSGWVIEPYRYGEKLLTQVTYLVQVDMGGVPSTLVNYVARRQPLAVAYLRDYLESTSLNSTRHNTREYSSSSSRPSSTPSNSILNGNPPNDLTMMFKSYM